MFFMNRSIYEKAKSIEEIKQLLHLSAIVYSFVCNKQILFICRKKAQNAEYHYYETYYGKENFIHLVGCESNNKISAEKFYEVCLETDNISTDYITFKESRRAASGKLEVFASLFDFQHVKIYKIGRHDKINEHNNFQVGLGNVSGNGVLGYTKYNGLPVPTTVLVNPLSEYVTAEESVLACLTKTSDKYDTVIGAIKTGIAIDSLPSAVRNKIKVEGGVIKMNREITNKKMTLEDALKRIEKLEKENKELREELEYFKKRKASGRQKHNAKWMEIYNDFVVCHEAGMSVIEIAERNDVSERTIYRYKAYYEKMK